MPWCDDCSKFYNPPTLGDHGECPGCGTVIAEPSKGVPWHFKLMVVALVIYLGYRLYQLIAFLVVHL